MDRTSPLQGRSVGDCQGQGVDQDRRTRRVKIRKHLSGTRPVINSGFAELKCSMAQLALAWVAKVNPYTSTVILGATKPQQVIQNLGAINVLPKLTPEIMEKIEKVLDNKPTQTVSHRSL